MWLSGLSENKVLVTVFYMLAKKNISFKNNLFFSENPDDRFFISEEIGEAMGISPPREYTTKWV